MSTMVFVNFPVSDIQVSTDFYEKLGFKKNPDFSDDLVSCMVWDENFYIMLLSHERYQTFIGDKTIADTHKVSGALLCLYSSKCGCCQSIRQTCQSKWRTIPSFRKWHS